ncbi:hypothetical protein [Paremcibacter congregatus]|uniref:F0F1 ATP synthase subunit epsilon n=1 Tax=Paremcibacter congregatus TaxID=2043170 RepID=UPI0030EBFAB9|tara:strand:- start:899 stop:1300 length:402 start_codon:yes stop_codon:yes gene_type:complete
MKFFTLNLQSGLQYEKIENVISFIGTDAQGAFGVMAGHERMMTILRFGLARFRGETTGWHYIALPGGVLYFVNNVLSISCRRFVQSEDYSTVAAVLSGTLKQQEEELLTLKRSLGRMEQETIRRIWKLQHEEV